MKHALSLYIPDTMNDWSLTIQDTSVYSDIIPITCPTLQILVPGFVSAVTVNDQTMPNPLAPNFTRTFTACDLELQTQSCGTQYDCLPDGVYVIKYSVSPNDVVYVEYNHLRMVKALKKWNTKLCELELAPCDPPSEKKSKLDELMKIKAYFEAAKNMVEFCHRADKGMELYNFANKLLDKLDCKTC
jgi:hypothetical protein